MDKVDFVLVGSEAVVESGGLINAVGSNQMAIIAKAANKPFYALAERCVAQLGFLQGTLVDDLCFSSYKFHRLFPLSQYDLPTHNPNILSFPPILHRRSSMALSSDFDLASSVQVPSANANELQTSPLPPLNMTAEQISRNPDVDYTRYAI